MNVTSRDLVGQSAADVLPLAVRDLSVGYGGQAVVRDVSLDIQPREITALIGPNGCGKSTLLKALARVLRPTQGQILLDGRPLAQFRTREIARRMALLPQGPVAPDGLKVHELVAQGRFPHQTLFRQWSPQDRDAVERALAHTDLERFADRPVASLSGGQRQRCWLAMVLAQDTPLMLLDEPTTFLDLKVQVDLMALLRRIVSDEGRTMVLVLHELNLAAAFTDRVVMMRDGQIVRQGPPQDIFTSEGLSTVFDLHADVVPDPVTGRPVCLPRAPHPRPEQPA